MEQMIAQEFCRQTKLHMDEILSAQHYQIDVSKLIEVMQSTIEFETDLQNKFDSNNFAALDDFESNIKIGAQVQIESGSAKEIAAKYKNNQVPQKKLNRNREMLETTTDLQNVYLRFLNLI